MPGDRRAGRQRAQVAPRESGGRPRADLRTARRARRSDGSVGRLEDPRGGQWREAGDVVERRSRDGAVANRVEASGGELACCALEEGYRACEERGRCDGRGRGEVPRSAFMAAAEMARPQWPPTASTLRGATRGHCPEEPGRSVAGRSGRPVLVADRLGALGVDASRPLLLHQGELLLEHVRVGYVRWDGTQLAFVASRRHLLLEAVCFVDVVAGIHTASLPTRRA